MDRKSIRFRYIDGEVETPSTEPDATTGKRMMFNLQINKWVKKRTPSDSANLKTRNK